MSPARTRRALIVSAGASALSACVSPYVLKPLQPPPGFTGPHMEADAFIVRDGARLPFLKWGPDDAEIVVVALHGVNDHAMSFHMAGPWWAKRGVRTYAYDQRGFGDAPGRGLWPGRKLLTDDLRDVAALVRARHPAATVMAVGESMGGSVVACALASDDTLAVDRAILLAPAVWGWSSQSWINRMSLRAAARLARGMTVTAPDFIARRIRASDNTAELIRMGRDPKMIGATRFDVVHGLVNLMEAASWALGRMKRSALLMYGAHDQLVEPEPMRLALKRAKGADTLRTAYYPDGWHLLNRDLNAEVVYADALAYMHDPAGHLPSDPEPVQSALQRLRSR